MFLTGCWSATGAVLLLFLDLGLEPTIVEPDDEVLPRLTDFRTDKVAFLIKNFFSQSFKVDDIFSRYKFCFKYYLKRLNNNNNNFVSERRYSSLKECQNRKRHYTECRKRHNRENNGFSLHNIKLIK